MIVVNRNIKQKKSPFMQIVMRMKPFSGTLIGDSDSIPVVCQFQIENIKRRSLIRLTKNNNFLMVPIVIPGEH